MKIILKLIVPTAIMLVSAASLSYACGGEGKSCKKKEKKECCKKDNKECCKKKSEKDSKPAEGEEK